MKGRVEDFLVARGVEWITVILDPAKEMVLLKEIDFALDLTDIQTSFYGNWVNPSVIYFSVPTTSHPEGLPLILIYVPPSISL
jgi:hypothetical protein